MTDQSIAEVAAEEPWQFTAIIEGDKVRISAVFAHGNIERFAQKLDALKAVLDEPAHLISQGADHDR